MDPLKSISKEEIEGYFEILKILGARSSCLRRSAGSLLLRDRRIISTGYNGSPSGTEHCSDTGCLREVLGIPSGEGLEKCRAIHAEQSAILQCAIHGVSSVGSLLFTTYSPCLGCAKTIVQVGIIGVVYKEDYTEIMGKAFLDEAGIALIPKEELVR